MELLAGMVKLKEDNLVSSAIVMFDGFCNLCSSLTSFLIKIDKNERLVFIPFQGADYQSLINKYPEFKENPESVIFIYESQIYKQSTALLKIFSILGFPWRIFNIVKILPKKFLDSIYNLIAAKRYSIFGKRNYCYIPNKRNI